MICVICRTGETLPGFTVVTIKKNNKNIIFKDVPAEICQQCDEYYLSEEITQHTVEMSENIGLTNNEIEILNYEPKVI